MSTPYPPAPPPVAPPPKKTSPLVWIIGGCGVLVVLIILVVFAGGLFVAHKVKQAGFDPELMKKNPAVAVTKMMAAMNPDVQVLKVDEDRGVVTLRDKKTGKTLTMDFEDVKKGKIVFKGDNGEEVSIHGEGESGSFSVKSKEGTFSMGGKWNPPAWVPTYRGATVQASASGQGTNEDAGAGFFNTTDSMEDVFSFYEGALKGQGMKVTRNVISADGKNTMGTLMGNDEASNRSVSVHYMSSTEGTKVMVSYNAKK